MASDHHIEITSTGIVVIGTGRFRYRVVCWRCRLVLHEATTSPAAWVRRHLDGEACAYERPMMGAAEVTRGE